MVDLETIENKIEALEVFFKWVLDNPENIDISSSGAGVEYGLKCVNSLKKSLIAYKKKPTHKPLKDIFFGLTAITRGVESFNDYDLEKQFREVTKGIYTIQEDLQQTIKW